MSLRQIGYVLLAIVVIAVGGGLLVGRTSRQERDAELKTIRTITAPASDEAVRVVKAANRGDFLVFSDGTAVCIIESAKNLDGAHLRLQPSAVSLLEGRYVDDVAAQSPRVVTPKELEWRELAKQYLGVDQS